jgi:HlyD family secretion protein
MKWGVWGRVIAVVGLLLVGAALGGAGVSLPESWNRRPPKVSRSDGDRLKGLASWSGDKKPTAVAAIGRLEPQGQVIDIAGLMGDRVGKLEVKEGAEVKARDILGYLESHTERKAERDAIDAQLKEAEARLQAETAFSNAQIKEAEIALRQAKELDPLDIKAQEARVKLLTTELQTASSDLQRFESLTTPGAVSAQKMDQQRQAVRRAEQELIAAQATLTKVREGRKLSEDQASARLEEAKAGLERVKGSSQVDSLKKNLELANRRLERTILRAPRDGRVLQVLVREGERADAGPILKLGDTSTMYAVAEVYETDILRVKPNQRSRVTSRVLEKPLTGTVERLGWLIFKNDVLHIDPAAAADARVVQVWIRLDPSAEAPKLTNLQVDVEIYLSGTPSPLPADQVAANQKQG